MKITCQKGFTVVEGLLIVVIVGILAGTGFYVYNANKKSGDALNSTNDSTTPSFKKKSSSQDTTQQYLSIKELGIKLPVSSQLKGLKYTTETNEGIVSLTTTSFEDASKSCEMNKEGTIITVTKHDGVFDKNPDKQFDQIGAFDTFGKQFSGYYISYGTPDGGGCQSAAVKQQLDTLKPEVINSVKNAQQL